MLGMKQGRVTMKLEGRKVKSRIKNCSQNYTKKHVQMNLVKKSRSYKFINNVNSMWTK